MKINVALLTHNEETAFRTLKCIHDCEGSRGIVQVLDDHSEPSYANYIRKLCREYGFQFAQRRLDFDFAAQWNAAFDLLPKNEFALRLDADEIIGDNLLNDCAFTLESNPLADCLTVMVRHVIVDDEVYVMPSVKSESAWAYRVLLNNGVIRWAGKCHETPVGMKHVVEVPENESVIVEVKTVNGQLKRKIWHEAYFKEAH